MTTAPRLCTVLRYHAQTNRLRHRLGQPRLALDPAVVTHPGRRVFAMWTWYTLRGRARAEWHRYGTAWRWAHTAGPACIARHEGGLTSVNPAGYYGRWQADVGFQTAYNLRAYQLWGTANHWPEPEQDLMAYRGWLARGWSPWSTAALCGL